MTENEKLNSVHCMRFFAAMAVVVHHVTTGFGNKSVMVGAAGVDIFFVISGIVIGMSIVREEAPYSFAVKRFIRVVPLYWIATAVYAIFRIKVWGMSISPDDLVRSFFLWPRFGTDWIAIYYPAWTLTYEMLFYCVASIVLFISRSNAWAVTLAVFTLVGLFRIPVPGAADGAFFSTAICLEFCMGLAFARPIVNGWRPSRMLGAGMLLAGAALLWFNQNDVTLITEQASHFHLARPLGLGIPAMLIVVGMLAFEDAKWLRNRLFDLGGAASYAIYLTHVITLDFTLDRLARMGIEWKAHPLSMQFSLIVVALAAGVATHLYIERPLLGTLKRAFLTKRPRTLTPA